MHCSHCGAVIPPNAQFCQSCGAQTNPMPAHNAYGPPVGYGAAQKDRGTYILLGILLGLLGLPGIHNLYAGRTGIGLIQLLGTILSCWILWLPFIIWTIVEVCTTRVDGNGVPMR